MSTVKQAPDSDIQQTIDHLEAQESRLRDYINSRLFEVHRDVEVRQNHSLRISRLTLAAGLVSVVLLCMSIVLFINASSQMTESARAINSSDERANEIFQSLTEQSLQMKGRTAVVDEQLTSISRQASSIRDAIKSSEGSTSDADAIVELAMEIDRKQKSLEAAIAESRDSLLKGLKEASNRPGIEKTDIAQLRVLLDRIAKQNDERFIASLAIVSAETGIHPEQIVRLTGTVEDKEDAARIEYLAKRVEEVSGKLDGIHKWRVHRNQFFPVEFNVKGVPDGKRPRDDQAEKK